MNNLFGKKKTTKEQVRETDRALRKVNRDLDRDRNALEREEKKLEADIKKAAKQGNKQAATVLAKQLIQLRKQKQRSLVASSQVTAVGYNAKAMGTNVKMAEAMGQTTKTMAQMNKVMKPEQVAKDMQAFSMANDRMAMTEEVMNDALDDILADSDDEEEQDAIVTQVLDEIGIEISGKVLNAPSAGTGKIGESSKSKNEDKEIEDLLAQLKA